MSLFQVDFKNPVFETCSKAPPKEGASNSCLGACAKASEQDWNECPADRRNSQEKIDEDLGDPGALFYEACQALQKQDAMGALRYFQQRARLKGDPEERYLSLYECGRLQEEKQMSSEVFLNHYHKAYEAMPERAEALYGLVKHHIGHVRHNFAYILLKAAAELPKPEGRFVTHEMHDYQLSMYLADVCHMLGRSQESLEILRKLSMKALPQGLIEQIRKNINVLEQIEQANRRTRAYADV